MWTVSTFSLSSFPTHVLPVLLVRMRLCILCVPPKFHNLPSRGNIVMIDNLELVHFHKNDVHRQWNAVWTLWIGLHRESAFVRDLPNITLMVWSSDDFKEGIPRTSWEWFVRGLPTNQFVHLKTSDSVSEVPANTCPYAHNPRALPVTCESHQEPNGVCAQLTTAGSTTRPIVH